MVNKWLPRILAALPSIFIVIHGDQFSILPQCFVDWKKTHTIESAIFAVMLWLVCTMTVFWIQCVLELKGLKEERLKEDFSMNAKDAAQYIMKNLNFDLDQCNKWVTQMVNQGKLEIRGRSIENYNIFESIRPDLQPHESLEIYLIGDENQRRINEVFDSPYDDRGWAEITPQRDLSCDPIFVDLRFNSGQIKHVVSLYKAMETGDKK